MYEACGSWLCQFKLFLFVHVSQDSSSSNALEHVWKTLRCPKLGRGILVTNADAVKVMTRPDYAS